MKRGSVMLTTWLLLLVATIILEIRSYRLIHTLHEKRGMDKSRVRSLRSFALVRNMK